MAEQLAFDILARDVNASRTFDKFGDAVDDAGDDLKGFGKDADLLSKRIGDTEKHLHDLNVEFAKTGDNSLKKLIRTDERDLAFLQKVKRSLGEVADEAQDVGKKAGKQLTTGFGDAIQSLPAQVKGSLMVGIAATAAAVSPFLGAVIGGAVLGGVGAGGIIGGVALAAQDSRVKAAGEDLGQYLLGGLKASGQIFVAPLLDSMDELRDAGDDLTASLTKGFRAIAPTLAPLAKGIEGMARELGPGLEKAFEAAAPALRAIANELPKIGDAISDALTSIADESDGAVEGLIVFLNLMEVGIRVGGSLVGTLAGVYEWFMKIFTIGNEAASLVPGLGLLGKFFGMAGQGGSELLQLLEDAKDPSDDFAESMESVYAALGDTAAAAETARNGLRELSDSIADEFDPMANLVHRLQDVSEAQRDYNEAVKDHGKNSREAKDAELALAGAIVAANGAASDAAGTFSGKLTPAMHDTLKAGGMTEAQIHDIEVQFAKAEAAGNRFARTYKAKAVLDASALYGSLAAANNALNDGGYVSGRASGGPVRAGQTYWVGENGPELLTMSANGYVLNAAQSKQMASGASGGSSAPAGGGFGGGEEAMVRAFRAALSGMPLVLNNQVVGHLGDVTDRLARGF